MQITCKHTLSSHPCTYEHIHSLTSPCTHGGAHTFWQVQGRASHILTDALQLRPAPGSAASPPRRLRGLQRSERALSRGAGLCSWVPPGQLSGNSLWAGLRQRLLQALAHVRDTPENTAHAPTQTQEHRLAHPSDSRSAFPRTHPVDPQVQPVLPCLTPTP